MLTSNRPRLRELQFAPTWLRFAIIILIVLGICFRFVHLERKVYWHDEAYTSLRISGYTKAEFVQLFDGRVIGIEQIQKYQRPNPEKGVSDTINSLAVDDAQHPPLYYVMVRLWVQIFGDSVAATRSLSAIISLLAFPCMYWLCLELFQSATAAWVSLGLLAVSPIHVLYAQEARQFSLWTVTILLSSAVLLRAMRLGKARLWAIYAVTVALGLYTFLFSGLVAIAHGIYVVAIERRFSKTVKAYLASLGVGFIVFLPWILTIINSASQIEDSTASAQTRQSLTALLTSWTSNISYVFGDFWRYEAFFPDLHFSALRWGRYLVPLILILVIYSFLFIYRQAEKRVWLFIFALSGVPGLTLILSDLILGGKLSTRPRYVIPCYLGIQLAVTYLLANKITSAKLPQRQWRLVMIAVIATGFLSCGISSQAETWWSKGSHANPQIARIINTAANPLLISSNYSLNIGDLMSLSHLLNAKVQMQLVKEPNLPKIPDNFSSNVFLYNPSAFFKSELEKTFKLDNVYKSGRLWQISK